MRHGQVIVLGLVLAGFALSGCSQWSDKTPSEKIIKERMVMETEDLHRMDPSAMEEQEGEAEAQAPMTPGDADYSMYHIGPGDRLAFRFFGDETLTTDVVVRYDGRISLPLIPDVNVKGSTRQEATSLVREEYAVFYDEPQVSLAILEAGSKTFTVMGDVNQPAQYSYDRPLSLLDAITMAGGLRLEGISLGGQRVSSRGGDSYVGISGQLVKAFIIRTVDGQRIVTEHDLRDLELSGPHPSQTPIYPNDTVYVPEAVNLVYVLGEVGQPDVFELRKGMTLLQLLAQSGGFIEETGRLRTIVLMREIDPTHTEIFHINIRQIFKTGQDFPLEAGDIIYIPRKPLINARDFVQRFTGTISPILSLYNQALNTIYAERRISELFDDDTSNNIISVLQGLSGLGGIF